MSGFRFHDSLTREIREFTTIEPPAPKYCAAYFTP